MRKAIEHEGELSINKHGTVMEIIEYINNRNVLVEFQDNYKYITRTNYQAFKKGEVKNVYDKTVYNIGYIGEGNYSHKSHPRIYNIWRHMLGRCYDDVVLSSNPTYYDCYTADEWHCFQNFAKWYDDNYYEIPGESMELDKDILCKGNRIYSPDTCVFVPQYINTLIVKNDADRGELPIGCYYHCGSIYASCSIRNDSVFLGVYDDINEAFNVYKEFKEDYIKKVADEYRDYIPTNLYEAMYNWVVEIND